MNKLFVYTDGGSRGNPGKAAVGVVVKTENGQVIGRMARNIGEATNNVAEYMAVVKALEWLKEHQREKQTSEERNNRTKEQLSSKGMEPEISIQFYLDSVLVVNQLNGYFKVKDGKLRYLLLQIRILEQEVGGKISYAVIPREKNWEADRLVNEALDKKVLISNF
jgi:ribonuclease HI